MRLAIKKAEERDQLKRENLLFKEQIRRIEDRFRFGNLVAEKPGDAECFRAVRQSHPV